VPGSPGEGGQSRGKSVQRPRHAAFQVTSPNPNIARGCAPDICCRIERSIQLWTPAALESAIGEHLSRRPDQEDGEEDGDDNEDEEDEDERRRRRRRGDLLRARYGGALNAVSDAGPRRAQQIVVVRKGHVLWPCFEELHRAAERFR
jgi:hypothetical protein